MRPPNPTPRLQNVLEPPLRAGFRFPFPATRGNSTVADWSIYLFMRFRMTVAPIIPKCRPNLTNFHHVHHAGSSQIHRLRRSRRTAAARFVFRPSFGSNEVTGVSGFRRVVYEYLADETFRK